MIKIKIADHVFGLQNKYDFVRFMCRDYLCDDEPEVVFSLSDADLAAFDAYNKPETREHYALHGKIVNWLLPHDWIPFHGSCIALDGNAILFTAPSGTGKSTHTRLWRERFGDRVVMINDDKPLLQYHPDTDSWTAWGTPWCGKEGIHTNSSAPLRCIVVLRQAEDNSIRRLSPKAAIAQFLNQVFISNDDVSLRLKAIELIGQLVKLPVFELGCTISQEAVALSYDALTLSMSHEETQET